MKKAFLGVNCILFLLLLGLGPALADEAGQINFGSIGVADTMRVANILQVTKNADDDAAQCWGAYPWSADGQWIVYQADGKDSEEIRIMKADGTQGACLTDDDLCDSHPSFTPDGQNIVYQHVLAQTGEPEIWRMDVTGENKTSLTAVHGAVAGEQKPVISPDGSKIAYRQQSTIWAMDIDGTGPGDIPMPVRVSGGLTGSTKHTWSPDSAWILFNGSPASESGECEGDNDQYQRIHKVKSDGSELTKLSDESLDLVLSDEDTYTAVDKCENWAFWSPDGNWITFHANYDDEYTTLSIMKPDGTEKRHLVVAGTTPVELVNHPAIPGAKTLQPVNVTAVKVLDDENGDTWDWICGPKSWSPDSNWIAFKMTNSSDDSVNIFAYNVNTDEVVQLTRDYVDERLWWSPDGGKILFREGYASRDVGENGDDLLVLNLAPGFLDFSNVANSEVDHFEASGVLENVENGLAAAVTTDDGKTQPGTVMITKMDQNPTGFGFDGEYFDLFVSDPDARITGIIFRLGYTGTTPGAPYWFDGTAWVECSHVAEGTDETLLAEFMTAGFAGYIEITIGVDTSPNLTHLSATVFGLGEIVEPEPEPEPSNNQTGSNSPNCFINTLLGQ